MTNYVHIGARRVPFSTAADWVHQYFDEAVNNVSVKPYAYPFYDHLGTGSGANELNDGDMLAPTLLNVPMSIAAFRSLQSVRSQLQAGLADIPPTLALEDAVAQRRHVDLLTGIFAVLDSDNLRGVRLTMLSKVLHRKRPAFVPLYDSRVRACYVGSSADHPIAETVFKTQRWSEVVVRLAECITDDLTSQAPMWSALAAGISVSKLRLFDVVAWRAGR